MALSETITVARRGDDKLHIERNDGAKCETDARFRNQMTIPTTMLDNVTLKDICHECVDTHFGDDPAYNTVELKFPKG